MIKIGLIGGSGLDDPAILKAIQIIEIDTPYGQPSSTLKIGRINNTEVVLLARHGRQHTIPPSQVNYRANISALKQIGCTHIIATTAVGSLKEEIKPGDLVILDQFIDFTKRRINTFYSKFKPHRPSHCQMAKPFSNELRQILINGCQALNLAYHKTGTVVTVEGPRFSTKAESNMFRQWKADVINMSIATEAALANEIGIPYAAIAMSTDYDCWKENEEAVTWEKVLKTFNNNVEKVNKLLTNTLGNIKENTWQKQIKDKIRTVPDWPKPGIMFRDITTLLNDQAGLKMTINLLYERYKDMPIDIVAGIESRGFIIGSAIAYKLSAGFVPIRKKGKLPAKTITQEYALEYGTDQVEIHQDAIQAGQNVLLIDDLIATGGTALAATQLIKKLAGNIIECAFIINLPNLGGLNKLKNEGYKTFNLVEFSGG